MSKARPEGEQQFRYSPNLQSLFDALHARRSYPEYTIDGRKNIRIGIPPASGKATSPAKRLNAR